MRRSLVSLVTLAAIAVVASLGAPADAATKKKTKPAPVAAKPLPKLEPKMEIVTLPSPEAPLVAIRLLFSVGSIDDPQGKEGLAALTTMMLTEAGTAKRTYSERIDAFYPMAANLNWNVDRELTVLAGVIHRDNLAAYTDLLVEAVTQPRFDGSDFERNKEQLLASLTTTLRSTNDELLGLEALQGEIFAGHPYEHSSTGTVQGLKAITLDDVKKFYAEKFTQRRLLLARMLVRDARIFVLDEPEAGLPSATAEEIMKLIAELNRSGITIVVVTHDPDVAAAARRQIRFKDGRVVSDTWSTGAQ